MLTTAQSSVVQDGVDLEQEQLRQELKAYQAMHHRLLVDYSGHWVAIYKGQLLDHDLDENVLMARLDKEYPEILALVRQVEADVDRDIYVPSFRLAA